VSNTDTKSYKAVVDKLCEGVTDPEELIREIHGRIINKHGRETILASLTGVVSEAEKDTMRQLRQELTLAEGVHGEPAAPRTASSAASPTTRP